MYEVLLHWYPPVGVFIAILGLLGIVVPLIRDLAKMGKWEKSVWTFVMFALMLLELRSIYLDRRAHDTEQARARAEQLQHFKEIGEGIKASIADSDRKFAATMGKENQVLENITGGNSFAIVTPQVWAGLAPIPLSIRNQGKQTLTGVTITIRNAQNFNLDRPESFYETQTIDVGTLHPGELRLLKEKLTPSEHAFKAEDGLPVDLFDLDIAAQNFTAEEHLIFKKGDRIPWVFKYQVTQQYIKSRHGKTIKFGYNVLANQKEWLGEK